MCLNICGMNMVQKVTVSEIHMKSKKLYLSLMLLVANTKRCKENNLNND